MRIFLKVSYDGTAYHGWQAQKNEPATIEGVLNDCLTLLTGAPVEVTGCSRTDAGVHARGNVCIFDTASAIPPDRYVQALNGVLPADVRILDSFRVDDLFHPRHADTRKTYCYRLFHGEICPPFERLYRHHVYGPLDVEAMQEAAGAFMGEHDFAAFCAAGSHAETTVREIYGLGVTSNPARGGMRPACPAIVNEAEPAAHDDSECVDICVTGSGFLYNMVRIIAGTLLEAGRGRIRPGDVAGIIAGLDRSKAGPTLPPGGLCLESIEYVGGVPRIP